MIIIGATIITALMFGNDDYPFSKLFIKRLKVA